MATLIAPRPRTPRESTAAHPVSHKQPWSGGRLLARRIVTAVLFFAALVGAWHLIVQQLPAGRQVILPPPLSVWEYLVESVQTGDLFTALRVTMKRLLIGYF